MSRQEAEFDSTVREAAVPAASVATHSVLERIRLLLETIPIAVLNCDRDGLIEYFNSQAAALWGRTPAVRSARDRFCGSYRIYQTDGELVPHADGPMALALRTGAPQLNRECILERPDGSRVAILVNVMPQINESGQVTGAVSCMLDITERKRTDGLLRAREQEFRTIVESSPDVIVRYDRQLRRIFVNSAATATLKLSKDSLLERPAGSEWAAAGIEVKPEEVEALRASIGRVFETGELQEFSLAWPGLDGRRSFDVRLAPEFGSDGSIVSVLAIGRDITRLKATEETLRRVQEYLAEGQRLNHTGSWAWSAKTRENMFWSAETYRIFGLEPRGATGGFLLPASYRDTISRVHPDDRDAFEQPVDRAIRDRKDFERRYRILMPDGAIKHIHSYGHPVLDESGEVIELVGTAVDVTERKFTDALLAAEKHMLEMIAGGTSLPTVLNDLCGALDELSAGLISTILIMDADGRKLWPTAGPHMPEAWSRLITPFSIGPRAGSCGTAAYSRQPVVVANISTDPLWAGYQEAAEAHGLRACWSTPILSITGQVLGTFAMYYGQPRSPQPRDLRLIDRAVHLAQIAIERDRTQASLREAQMNLARISRITTVGELTAAIAHEVNQPLAAVETNADACVRWLGASPPNLGEARLAAGRIASDAKRAGDIITGIRALLRKGDTVGAPVDLNEIIQEIVIFMRQEATRQKVTVATELAANLPRVTGDRVQLQQVVLNLVMNAIESMSAVEDRPRVLTIRTDRPGPDSVRAAVSDTGVGMTPRQMERLFEAFYTTKANGLGMGLAISRSIVEAHGGCLTAAPNNGPGVTFLFSLPLDEGNTP